ncbi:hypothetical protein [Lactobacillus helveticus]|uniref:DUF2178 domain-containing protein n=1 Tax=Lactobacillus helveticus TaxID=1587 RepID=A0A3Q8SMI6_LACHE|nr:hypothetical protein [Lactobacillus helveticus]AFR22100.1 hypothetical protein R0052_06370 [Lactobacillus helveticus R0052]AZK90735.1 hypothetical protein LH5_00474 [Lactobacillus helveticus]MCJ2191204.1 hypothetical protein [Lactobacillus helveticus]UOE22658.1 hypothetical protein MTX28_05735 [Lactobacillus helveticus]UWE05374.1 hypothetical protein NW893_05760 [Lactobacillus helveticus]
MRKTIKLVQLLLIALTLLVGLFCAATAWMAFNNGDQKVMCIALICALICFVGSIAYLKMVLNPVKEEPELAEDHKIKVAAAYQTLSILDHMTIGISIVAMIISTYLKNSNSANLQTALTISLTLFAVWLLGNIINIICSLRTSEK